MKIEELKAIRENAKTFANDSGICFFRVIADVDGVEKTALVKVSSEAVQDVYFRLHECLQDSIHGLPGGDTAVVLRFELVQHPDSIDRALNLQRRKNRAI